ncbi:MAG: hypothetical protein OEL53_15290 [Rhodospirillales bacterium]|nr:hypothetical protein [Rhodospirillales bacterium]
MTESEGCTRRQVLTGAAGLALLLPFARMAKANETETSIETPDNLFCAYPAAKPISSARRVHPAPSCWCITSSPS